MKPAHGEWKKFLSSFPTEKNHFHYALWDFLFPIGLACMLNSLVRVSRRDELVHHWNQHYLIFFLLEINLKDSNKFSSSKEPQKFTIETSPTVMWSLWTKRKLMSHIFQIKMKEKRGLFFQQASCIIAKTIGSKRISEDFLFPNCPNSRKALAWCWCWYQKEEIHKAFLSQKILFQFYLNDEEHTKKNFSRKKFSAETFLILLLDTRVRLLLNPFRL